MWTTLRKFLDNVMKKLYHVLMDNKIIWAAGFIDGEGTITIKRIKRKGFIYHQPYITCSQTTRGKECIEILKELFGGSISHYKFKTGKNWGDVVQWTVASQKALSCAKLLLPYLVYKKPLAKLLISFYDLKRENVYRLEPLDYSRRDDIYEKMRNYNVKGKVRLQRLSEKTPQGDATV